MLNHYDTCTDSTCDRCREARQIDEDMTLDV